MISQKIHTAIREVPDFPKPGINFKDITTLLLDPVISNEIVDAFIERLKGKKIDAIVGVESRGFLFGLPVSIEKKISFVLVRKKGKLPYKTISADYNLEYGQATIEMNLGDIGPGDRVIIHDDLLATGGTACAAAKLIIDQGAIVDGFSFIIELDFLKGRKNLITFSKNINSIVKY